MPWLTFLIFLPVLGAIFILLLPRENLRGIRTAAVFFGSLNLLIAVAAWNVYDSRSPLPVQMVEGRPYDPARPDSDRLAAGVPWIPGVRAYYLVGVDGISMPLVFLTAFIGLAGICLSLNVEHRVREYFFLLLLLEGALAGVFCALDLVLFLVFWESMLVVVYLLMGIWGGPGRRFAAMKFFIVSLTGTLLLFLGIIILYRWSELRTFNLLELRHQAETLSVLPALQYAGFVALFLAFALHVPVFPFHTSVRSALAESPPALSLILAGVFLNTGVYGLIRVSYPVLTFATVRLAFWLVAGLGVVNLLHNALCALAQVDLRRLAACVCIGQTGFCLLGLGSLSEAGTGGAAFQMVAQGLAGGLLVLLAAVLSERMNGGRFDGMGGLASQMPRTTGLMALAVLALLGTPGLAGFVGQFSCLLGTFSPSALAGPWVSFVILGGVAMAGILVMAASLVWMFQRVFLGPPSPPHLSVADLDVREMVAALPLAAALVLLGLRPSFLWNLIGPASEALVRHVEGTARASLQAVDAVVPLISR